MTETADQRHWNVQDGPTGPVEQLLSYGTVVRWLQEHTGNYSDLVLKWCRDYPEYVHDRDPRGHQSRAASIPVRLDDGGFLTVCDQTHIGHDGVEKTTVQILRLPPRALSLAEAKGIADRLNRIIKHADEQRCDCGELACPCGCQTGERPTHWIHSRSCNTQKR